MHTTIATEEPRKNREVKFLLAMTCPLGNIFKFEIDGVPFEHVGIMNQANHVLFQLSAAGYLPENERFALSQDVRHAEFTWMRLEDAPPYFRQLLDRYRRLDYSRLQRLKERGDSDIVAIAQPDHRPSLFE